jgi:hypothetical protein
MNYSLHDDVDRLATVENRTVINSSDEKAGVTAINDRPRSVRNITNVPGGQWSRIHAACDRHTSVARHSDSSSTRDGYAIVTGYSDATAACNRRAIFARDSDAAPVCYGNAIVGGHRSTAPRHCAGTIFARPRHATPGRYCTATIAADSVGSTALSIADAEQQCCAREQDQGMQLNGSIHGNE